MEKVTKLLEDVKLKSQLEARYYQGAIEALQLVIESLKEEAPVSNERPEERKRSSSKGPKP